ncbi:MAG TPA: hypothetical protein VNH15_08530 [Elusimicrobiota bacterium]|nr:hypothetical protein [Elusimicrobiota bacterium]
MRIHQAKLLGVAALAAGALCLRPAQPRAQEEAAQAEAFAAPAGAAEEALSPQVQSLPANLGTASPLGSLDAASIAGLAPAEVPAAEAGQAAAPAARPRIEAAPSRELAWPAAAILPEAAAALVPNEELSPRRQTPPSAKSRDSFWERVFLGRPNNTPEGTPPGFGAPDGIEIANKDRILDEINRALGVTRPPDFEAIWVRPFPMAKIFNHGLGTNPFGHIALRYTKADGTQRVMNIVGVKGHEMVNFLKPEDYFYSTRGFIMPKDKNSPDFQQHAEEQGGVYNRGMFGLRIERLPPGTVAQLDAYFNHLMTLAEADKSKFSLGAAEVLNEIDRLVGSRTRYGNCALWSSSGLAAARLLKRPSFWPKKVWVELYEKYRKIDPQNVHVVAYQHITQAAQTFPPVDIDMNGLVSPWNWIKNLRYRSLERRADVVVEVPQGSTIAQVRRVKNSGAR